MRGLMNGLLMRQLQLPVPAGVEIVEAPDTVTQLLPPAAELLVAAGDSVVAGASLCRLPGHGMFASISGRVRRIMPWDGGPRGGFIAVIIDRKAAEGSRQLFDPIRDATAFSADTVRERSSQAGFSFPGDNRPLLFTALDEDIDRVTNRWFVEKEFERVIAGLKVLRHLCGDRTIVIALPASMTEEKRNRCLPFGEVIVVPCEYPDTLSDLIIRNHPVLGHSHRVAVIDCKRLLELSATLSTGRVVTTMHVSLRIGRKGQVRLFQVAVGMSIGQLLSLCKVTVTKGMQIILGGEMSGASADGVHQPLTPDTNSILVLPPHEVVKSENRPCVNCGRCHRICPVRLRVDLIGKNVEFSLGKEAVRLGIDRCIDCGLCTSVCIVRRPMAHLMAFGKSAFLSRENSTGGTV